MEYSAFCKGKFCKYDLQGNKTVTSETTRAIIQRNMTNFDPKPLKEFNYFNVSPFEIVTKGIDSQNVTKK